MEDFIAAFASVFFILIFGLVAHAIGFSLFTLIDPVFDIHPDGVWIILGCLVEIGIIWFVVWQIKEWNNPLSKDESDGAF